MDLFNFLHQMKITLQIIFLLFFSLTQAQKPVDTNIKKDTTTTYEYKPRWYLNNIIDSTKVIKDIEKSIENLKKEQELEKKQLKQKPVVSPYSILAIAYRKKPLQLKWFLVILSLQKPVLTLDV